jgi:hypothetical protein
LQRDTTYCLPNLAVARAGEAVTFRADPFETGSEQIVIANEPIRLLVSPNAGGRVFVFQDVSKKTSIFTTVGALRDDVTVQPPESTTDRIARYTHQFPAGTFNRPYRAEISEVGNRAVVHLTCFTVEERVRVKGSGPQAAMQRGVSLTSLAVGNPRDMSTQVVLTPEVHPFTPSTTLRLSQGNAVGFYDRKTYELGSIAWRLGDVESAEVQERGDSIVARLVLAANRTARTVYCYDFVPTTETARARLDAISSAVAQGHPVPPANERK